MLSIYKYVSGDGKWERPFMVTGFGDEKFEWDHGRIADLLERQYTQHEAGPHCENTKVWFSCNSAAALGVYLYDRIQGTRKHRPVESWLEYARHNYMKISRDGKLESVTRYYDPLVDYKLNIAPDGGVNIAFLLVPQQRELATLIYDAAANALGWRNPAAAIRASAPGLLMARALGDHAVVSRLSAAAENEYEPRFFGDRDQKFGWFFRLNEAYPRGQQSATMMVSEVGDEGAWIRAFEAAHLDKFNAPTVEGIDFPSLGVYQAWNDRPAGILRVGTYSAAPDRRGAETSWRVTNLPNAADVSVRCDGEPFNRVEIVGSNVIRLNTTVDTHAFEIFTRYRGAERVANPAHREAKGVTGAMSSLDPMPQDPEALGRATTDLLTGRGPSCPCCTGSPATFIEAALP